MIKTMFPVVRRGKLASSTVQGTGEVKPLQFSEGQKALEQLDKLADDFASKIEAAAQACARDTLRTPWSIVHVPSIELRAAGRSPALGAIFDFKEFSFLLRDSIVVARVGVTLCVFDDGKDSAPDVSESDPVKSKFWARFIMATLPSGDNPHAPAVDVPIEKLIEFNADCEKIGDAIFDAIRAPYADIISAATDKPFEVSLAETFSVFAIGSRDEDFAQLFEQARAGLRLSDIVRSNGCAVRLTDLGYKFLTDADAPPKDAQEIASRFGVADIRLIIFGRPSAKRGLFLAKFTDTEAKFVGLTRIPDNFEPALNWTTAEPGRLNKYSANVVSAGLISEYGSYF